MISNGSPATMALIIASAVVFVAMHLFGDATVMRPLLITEYVQHAQPLIEIRNGEWWRLFTPMLLHFDIFHAVFNLLWIWVLGRVIEARHGALVLLLLTAIVSVSANLAQFFVAGPLFGGMSGVLYGYFGYLLIQGWFNPSFGFALARPLIYLGLGWFALGWSQALEWFGLRIANTAHTAGLLCGIVLAALAIIAHRVRAANAH